MHSRIGHGWFKKGIRTPVKKKLGFKNFYTYVAASPDLGKGFSLLAPCVNTECMNIFLLKMSRRLKTKKAFLILDQAGWHKSKDLVVPKNITLIYLPPYSPELNPVERLWQHLKDNILKNRIYNTLASLENAVGTFLSSLQPSTIRSICNVNYMSN